MNEPELDVAAVSAVFRAPTGSAEGSGFRTGSWRLDDAAAPRRLLPLHATVLHAFASAAKLGEACGVTLVPDDEDDAEEYRSYATLYRQAHQLARVLVEEGIQAGDRVLLVLPTSFEFLTAFFGAQMAGAIPVPAYPPGALEKLELSVERLTHIAKASGAAACVTTGALRPLLGQLAQVKSLRAVWSVEAMCARTPTETVRVLARATDAAFIQYTSGSTEAPKGVLLEHRNLVSNLHGSGQAAQINHADRMVSWLPLYHDLGLIGGLLWPIYWKIPLVLMSPTAFLLRPARWLRTISKHRGTISLAPNFAYAMCVRRVTEDERDGLDLSSWRLAVNGAEPVHLRSVLDFEEAFTPHGFSKGVMYPCYGLAESTVAVTFSTPGMPVQHRLLDRDALCAGRVVPRRGPGSVALVACGTPIPGHEVLIADEDGNPVAEDQIGHVLVRGPSVMRGYFRNEPQIHTALREGWLWTGDLGFIAPEGLYITGRAKDLIILRGKKYYAEDLERMAERLPGVRPGGTAAFAVYDDDKAQDAAVLVCETREVDLTRQQALREQIIERVAADAGIRVDKVVFVPPGTVPKTSSGKRQRTLCRELYLTDRLRPSRTGRLKVALTLFRSMLGHASLRRRT